MRISSSYDSLYVMTEKRSSELVKELENALIESGEDPCMAAAYWPHHYQSLNCSHDDMDVVDFLNTLSQNSSCSPDLYIKNLTFKVLEGEDITPKVALAEICTEAVRRAKDIDVKALTSSELICLRADLKTAYNRLQDLWVKVEIEFQKQYN